MAGHIHEPYVVCPKCSHQSPLTESIAAPLLEAERRGFQEKLVAREAEFARKADELRRQQIDLTKARESLDKQISQRLQAERKQVIATEAKKARDQVADDLNAMTQQLAESRQLLEVRNAKLAEAQQAQAEALRKQRELDEKERELEITIEKRVQSSQAELVAKARQDVTDELRSQVSQKDAQIDSLGRTVEELKRKLEQGSQAKLLSSSSKAFCAASSRSILLNRLQRAKPAATLFTP
jgi:DNA repair exonuclease SbcCD ATPase subunit